ncbi:dihydrofolate reductase [Bosea sp. 2KB_26]|uniref:dihydrofolate reductase n=1 Tax=Bosea sp. 2KB_26 TaxID=3237475 RepID=UPI003F93621E
MIAPANPSSAHARSGGVPTFMIAAVACNGVIGRADGSLPWHAPADLRHFKLTTLNCVLVSGRVTAETLPDLASRDLVTISRSASHAEHGAQSPQEALHKAQQLARHNGRRAIAIIGGGQIYRAFLGQVDEAYISHINANAAGSATFPLEDHEALPWRKRAELGAFEAEVDGIQVEGRFEHLEA